MKDELRAIEEVLGYRFQNSKVLSLARIHRSYWNEHRGEVEGHNERLEFLGDAVLSLIVAHHLYTTLPHVAEGQLTQLRAQLVDCTACAKICLRMRLDSYLLLGKGETLNVGRGRESILGDFFEALIGAVFVDGGLPAAIHCFAEPVVEALEEQEGPPSQNWKSQLQDLVQKQYRVTPIYQTLEESGPDHARHFRVAVLIGEKVLAEGEGASKKEAQMMAAQVGCQRLGE